MNNIRYLLFLFVIIPFSFAYADKANCKIIIEDVNASTKYKLDYHFTYTQESGAQYKHFKLPGSTYSCNFAYFNNSIGTMLSCEFDEVGNEFVQSDRSGNKEAVAINNLSFRKNGNFYTIEAACK